MLKKLPDAATGNEFYKVDSFIGIRHKIQLKNGEKIRIISTNSFGIDPTALEEFLSSFKEKIENFQGDEPLKIKRKNSFLETKFALFLIITLSIIGLAAIFIELFRGKGFNATMFVVLVPLLILIPALLRARIKKEKV